MAKLLFYIVVGSKRSSTWDSFSWKCWFCLILLLVFVHDTHRMYLDILFGPSYCLSGSTLHTTYSTTWPSWSLYSPNYPFIPLLLCTVARRCFHPFSFFFLARLKTTFEARHQCAKKKIYIYIFILFNYVYIHICIFLLHFLIYIYIIFYLT